jgi:hypothetical protein
MNDEIAAPEISTDDLPIAAYASEGLEDSRVWSPDDEAIELVDAPAREEPKIDADKIKAQAIEEYKAGQQLEIERLRAEAQLRLQQEALAAEEEEEFDLIERADSGDLEAQEAFYLKNLERAKERLTQKKTQAALEPERAAARNEIRRQLWEEYSKSFGVEPDDKDVLSIPADQGMRGINAALIMRTQDDAILDAARKNPAMQKWIKEEVAKATQAAGARAMARALGAEEAPRADAAAQTGGRTITSDELDRALMQNPDDSELYKLWVKRERAAGRYW